MVSIPDVDGLSVSKAALAYITAGIPIAVFDPSKGNGKGCGNLVGGRDGKWYERVTTDRAVIDSWRQRFGRFNGLCTSPGAIRCVVLDVDNPREVPKRWRTYLDDPSVPFVSTRPDEHPKRGHYWFSLPAKTERIGNSAFPWGDLRSFGGGLVLPPYGDRRTVRPGVPPTLPIELSEIFAGAGGVVESVDLEEFFSHHVTQTKPAKLTGITSLYRVCAERYGSRHKAAQKALTDGFGEARAGYVSARNVYEVIRSQWDKSERELRDLARWCAGVAMAGDLADLKAKSDRTAGTDSREYSHYFAVVTR